MLMTEQAMTGGGSISEGEQGMGIPARGARLLAVGSNEAPHLVLAERLVEDALADKVKDAAATGSIQPVTQLLPRHVLVIVQDAPSPPPASGHCEI